jgi:hypothetical protein
MTARAFRKVLASTVPALLLAALASACGTEPVPGAPSFEKDVLPIMQSRCIRCHGAGGTLNHDPTYVGHTTPLNSWLDSADDRGDCNPDAATTGAPCKVGARTRIGMILAFVRAPDSLRMPPAPAPRLTDRQIEVLQRWNDTGTKP